MFVTNADKQKQVQIVAIATKNYTPSIIQATTFRAALTKHGLGMAETIEVLNRGWHIEPEHNAVRPDHRMVAHTGFLTTARKLVTPAE